MERIVIMVLNEVGALAEITRVLAEADINLSSINTEIQGDHGAVIISTDNADTDHALQVLTDAGFTAVADDSLIIRLKDEPGALAKVAAQISAAGIDIKSLHILDRLDDYALVALSTAPEEREQAAALLDPDSIL